MAIIAPVGKSYYYDGNGDPLSGGKVYTYEAGTTTPKVTYTTQDESTANANPVILGSDGSARIWLADGGYKFKVTNSADVEIFTTDNIGGGSSAAFGANVNILTSNTPITDVYANSVNICTSDITLSLLSADSAREGFYFTVQNNSTGLITIDPDGVETINGASTYDVQVGQSAIIICNGTTWFSILTFDTTQDISFTGDNTFTGSHTVNGVQYPTKDGTSGQYLKTDGAGVATFGDIPDATETVKGIVELATNAETITGTDTNRAVTPAGLDAKFDDGFFESGELTITSAGLLTVAHGLGVRPKKIDLILRCKTDEDTYIAGDEIYIGAGIQFFGTTSTGVSVFTNDTDNLNLKFGSNSSVFTVPQATSGVAVSLLNTNWRLILKAWSY